MSKVNWINTSPDLLVASGLSQPESWPHKRLEMTMRESMNGLEDYCFELSLESQSHFEILAIEPAAPTEYEQSQSQELDSPTVCA